jgi:hypothetical protein
LADENDAVLAALIDRAGGAGTNARRVEAVVADARQIEEHETLDFVE